MKIQPGEITVHYRYSEHEKEVKFYRDGQFTLVDNRRIDMLFPMYLSRILKKTYKVANRDLFGNSDNRYYIGLARDKEASVEKIPS